MKHTPTEAEQWCDQNPEERAQLPVEDGYAQRVFLAFAPLMRRILERDPYALMGVSLHGFYRECVEEGTPQYEMRMLLELTASGASPGVGPIMLGQHATDAELDGIFEAYPPVRPHWDVPVSEGPKSARVRTTPETPVAAVSPLACAVCGEPADGTGEHGELCRDHEAVAEQMVDAVNEPSQLLQCLKVTKVDDPPIHFRRMCGVCGAPSGCGCKY